MKSRIKVVGMNDGTKRCYAQVKYWCGWQTIRQQHAGYFIPVSYSSVAEARAALDSFLIKSTTYVQGSVYETKT